MLLAGGQESGSYQDSAVEIYDPSTGSILLSADMPIGRSLFTLTTLWDGMALAVGGVIYDDGEFFRATQQTDLYSPL